MTSDALKQLRKNVEHYYSNIDAFLRRKQLLAKMRETAKVKSVK